MGHRAVIARYTADGSALVVAEPFAGRLANGPWDKPPVVGEPPPGTARSVRVCQLLAGAPPTRLSAELRRDGQDVVVVLLVDDPAELPVGPLLDEALRYGHRVVEAAPVTSRMARAVLVLTRDPHVPMAAYLLGAPLSGEDAVRRALAEYAVEGLVVRAQQVKEAARTAGLVNEMALLRASERDAHERARDAERRVTALTESMSALTERLTDLDEARLTNRARNALRGAGRAVGGVRRTGVPGTGLAARAVSRRLRRES